MAEPIAPALKWVRALASTVLELAAMRSEVVQ
jgi:hypothetical protein